MGEPYLRKGETITCPNGHEICDAKRDVYRQEITAVEDFENWRYAEANAGDRPLCPVCGEEYIRAVGLAAYRAHTARGWAE